MGRQEVPKPQPKPDPSQQRSGGQRGGGGQRQGGDPAAETKVDEAGWATRRPSQGGRGQGRRDQPRPEPEAVKDESWARVLEHDVKGGVATVMAEKTLVFCRVKVKGSDVMTVNQRIYIGKDRSKREAISAIIGMAHLDKMSNMAKADLPALVQMFVEEHGQYFVDEFYNKAGPMSLKQHSYELLPDVGPVKARNMVKAATKSACLPRWTSSTRWRRSRAQNSSPSGSLRRWKTRPSCLVSLNFFFRWKHEGCSTPR